jgi:ribose transport system substrate-binding protein
MKRIFRLNNAAARFRRRLGTSVVASAIAVSSAGMALPFIPAATASAATPSYTFVLSNNFLGNDWRPQVERLAQLTAKVKPFAGVVTVKVVNSQNTNEAQLSDLDNIIETKPSAILLIPGSSTALDAAITRACNAGILVLTLSIPVGAPCAINLNQSFYAGNEVMGQWMAKAMNGKGSVFIDTGIAGVQSSNSIENGFLAGLHQYGPKITIAGKYAGEYASGPEQAGISSLLTAHPTVGGIMTEGYCTPAFNALKAAGLKPVPVVCYAYNGEMEACAAAGHECALLTNATGQVQLAMQLALNILEKKVPRPHGGEAQQDWISYPMYVYTSSTPNVTLDWKGLATAVQTLKSGVNFFPNLSPGLSLPYTLPQFAKEITPQQAAG